MQGSGRHSATENQVSQGQHATQVFSPHHFFHKQAFKDRLYSSVDLRLQRQSKDVLGFLVFLGFFGFLGSCFLFFISFFSGTIC